MIGTGANVQAMANGNQRRDDREQSPSDAAEAELDPNEVVETCLRHMVAAGGSATAAELCAAVEAKAGGARLSSNGRACVLEHVNRYAVRTGLVLPHAPDRPGWHITAEGREFIGPVGATTTSPSPTTRAFEHYVLGLMHLVHPRYFWCHQGARTRHEQGLDLIGTRFPDPAPRAPEQIGVQVRLHDPLHAPYDEEWDRFFAGCFTRKIDLAIFVTTGCLTGAQRREASEAGVVVIAGHAEIAHLADKYSYARFEAEAATSRSASQPADRPRRSLPN